MKIGIVTGYAAKNPAGLERFSLDLLKALAPSASVQYTVYTKKGSGLPDIFAANGIADVPVVEVGFGKLWKDLGLFFAPRADVYVFNGPIVPFVFSPRNYFVILHDFAYRYIKPGSRKERWKARLIDILTRQAIRRAKKVITVSETTKKDLLELYGGDPDRVITIYPGFNPVCDIQAEPVPGVKEPYFLNVGTIKERKNTLAVVKAFSLFREDGRNDFSLVIVGKLNRSNPYVLELLRVIEELGLKDSVIFTGHITDGQMSYIYRHARALVFPSLLEGFGFPALEAMNCGLPVITSNRGSLAEISGEAAILADPLNADEISVAMKKIVEDEAFGISLVARGRARAARFSWAKTAEELERLVVRDAAIK